MFRMIRKEAWFWLKVEEKVRVPPFTDTSLCDVLISSRIIPYAFNLPFFHLYFSFVPPFFFFFLFLSKHALSEAYPFTDWNRTPCAWATCIVHTCLERVSTTPRNAKCKVSRQWSSETLLRKRAKPLTRFCYLQWVAPLFVSQFANFNDRWFSDSSTETVPGAGCNRCCYSLLRNRKNFRFPQHLVFTFNHFEIQTTQKNESLIFYTCKRAQSLLIKLITLK